WNLYTGAAADPAIAYEAGAAYGGLRFESATAPARIDRPRIYHASTRYYRIPVEAPSLVVELVGEPADLVDVQLFSVPRREERNVGSVAVAAGSAGSIEIDTSEADALIVGVANGARLDPSRRPTLCVGSADDV